MCFYVVLMFWMYWTSPLPTVNNVMLSSRPQPYLLKSCMFSWLPNANWCKFMLIDVNWCRHRASKRLENDPDRFKEQSYDKEHFTSEPVFFDNEAFDKTDFYVVNPEGNGRSETWSQHASTISNQGTVSDSGISMQLSDQHTSRDHLRDIMMIKSTEAHSGVLSGLSVKRWSNDRMILSHDCKLSWTVCEWNTEFSGMEWPLL